MLFRKSLLLQGQCYIVLVLLEILTAGAAQIILG